jgi:hypothetical protein
MMSPADLVAYLVGWSLLVLKWCDRKAQGVCRFPGDGLPVE